MILILNSKTVFGISIQIAAKVENEIITNIDVQNEKNYLFFLNPKLKELDEFRMSKVAKESLITEIIKRKELEKVFDLDKKYDFEEILEQSLIKRKKISKKSELLILLDKNKIIYEDFQAKLKIEGLWNQLIYNKYSNNIRIDKKNLKKEILSKYNNKKKKYEYNLSELMFAEKIDENLDPMLPKIIKSINEVGFENSANLFSISNTSKNGGLIGWVSELQISDNINSNIKNLKINQISKPIKVPNGYILIKLNNKKELIQKINIDDQVEKLFKQETNRQLNNFSIILFKRLKKNIKINE